MFVAGLETSEQRRHPHSDNDKILKISVSLRLPHSKKPKLSTPLIPPTGSLAAGSQQRLCKIGTPAQRRSVDHGPYVGLLGGLSPVIPQSAGMQTPLFDLHARNTQGLG